MPYILQNLSTLPGENELSHLCISSRNCLILCFLVFPFPASDGFLIYIRTSLFSQRVKGPSAKLQSFVCAASSCLILCLPHSNHCLVLFGSAVPELWPENCSQEVSWGNHRTHHLCFSSLRDHSPIVAIVECLKVI